MRLSCLITRPLVVFLVAAAILGLGLPHFIPAFPVVSDSLDYQVIADGLIKERTYRAISVDQILYPPGYPLFLATVFLFAGKITYAPVFFFQTVFLGLTAWLIYRLLAHLGQPPPSRWLGALLTFSWPYLLLYTHLVTSEMPYILLLISAITALVHGLERPWKWSVLAGCLFGCAILIRPVGLLIPLSILLLLGSLQLLHWIPRDTGQIKRLAIAFGVSIGVILPWTVAISAFRGTFTPVASNLSFVFKKGNQTLTYLPEYVGRGDNRVDLKSVFAAKARNVIYFWDPGASGYHMNALRSAHPAFGALLVLYKIWYFVLLAFAAFGLWTHRKKPAFLVIFGAILYVWATHTILFPFPRYTLPIIPLMLALAMTGMHALAYAFPHPPLHSRKK